MNERTNERNAVSTKLRSEHLILCLGCFSITIESVLRIGVHEHVSCSSFEHTEAPCGARKCYHHSPDMTAMHDRRSRYQVFEELKVMAEHGVACGHSRMLNTLIKVQCCQLEG